MFIFQSKKTWAFFSVVSKLLNVCTVDHLLFLLSPWMVAETALDLNSGNSKIQFSASSVFPL